MSQSGISPQPSLPIYMNLRTQQPSKRVCAVLYLLPWICGGLEFSVRPYPSLHFGFSIELDVRARPLALARSQEPRQT